MKTTEVLWLDAEQQVSLGTLAELSGLSDEELQLLTDYGLLEPLPAQAEEPLYRAECVTLARTAFRLRQDLELSLEGSALVLELLRRLRRLESELNHVRARMPRGL